MTATAPAPGQAVWAAGPRLYPWGTRIMAGLLATFVVAVDYFALGPPFALDRPAYLSATIWLGTTAAVIWFWVMGELLSAREVRLQPGGVTFRYFHRSCFVPWERLQLMPVQTNPRWARAVVFLEVDRPRGLMRALARPVTPEQARAILEAMPDPPQTPFALSLLSNHERAVGSSP